jgi:hypothetical protein
MTYSLLRCCLLGVSLVVLLSVDAQAGRRRKCCCPPEGVCVTPYVTNSLPPTVVQPPIADPTGKLPPIEDRGPLIDPAKLVPAS